MTLISLRNFPEAPREYSAYKDPASLYLCIHPGATILLKSLSTGKTTGMRKLFLLAICSTILVLTACRKNSDCTSVIITDSAPGCGGWGIVVNGTKYPSVNIPTQFQQNGKSVCAKYELYEDFRACACCGGTWAKINSMRNLNQ